MYSWNHKYIYVNTYTYLCVCVYIHTHTHTKHSGWVSVCRKPQVGEGAVLQGKTDAGGSDLMPEGSSAGPKKKKKTLNRLKKKAELLVTTLVRGSSF